MKNSIAFSLLLILISCLASCAAPNFEKRYAAAVAESGGDFQDVTGPWEGTWLSGHNQHTGELKAIVSKSPKGQNRYRFLYWATWAKMKGTFKFEGDSVEDGGVVKMSGAKRLGPFQYTHKAEMTKDQFEATYGSDKEDFGTFQLHRPEAN
ncbi:MAG: hypothetical protein ACI8UO_001283 [Verrucomicrobiales bacterium]|jgi:hypothetical protein